MAAVNRTVTVHRVLSGVLAIVALAGWGLFVYSATSSGSRELALRAEVARLQRDRDQAIAARDQVVAERDQLLLSAGNLQDVQRQLTLAKEQVQSLEQARAQLTDSIAQARSQLTSLLDRPAESERMPQTDRPPAATPSGARVSAAQEALTQLGYGKLKPDGVIGPNTRRAIEAFERARGLAVTGELGLPTVQALERAAGISIQ